MNLKKYMSTGLVVEDMNHLHGRFGPSKPGMIPRFDQRKMGAFRVKRAHQGGRHIVFGSKVNAQILNPSPMNKTLQEQQSSGAHREIAISSGKAPVQAPSRHGVFKRAHMGENTFSCETPNGYQQDLFEKIIPIRSEEGADTRFEIPIEFKEPVAQVAHDLPDRRPSFWRRVAQAFSRWLRKG
jgi:hypothetical protein